MVTENGEIHVTHKKANPFSKLEMVELAEEIGACSGTWNHKFLSMGQT
jgi:hypothetical protein